MSLPQNTWWEELGTLNSTEQKYTDAINYVQYVYVYKHCFYTLGVQKINMFVFYSADVGWKVWDRVVGFSVEGRTPPLKL